MLDSYRIVDGVCIVQVTKRPGMPPQPVKEETKPGNHWIYECCDLLIFEHCTFSNGLWVDVGLLVPVPALQSSVGQIIKNGEHWDALILSTYGMLRYLLIKFISWKMSQCNSKYDSWYFEGTFLKHFSAVFNSSKYTDTT